MKLWEYVYKKTVFSTIAWKHDHELALEGRAVTLCINLHGNYSLGEKNKTKQNQKNQQKNYHKPHRNTEIEPKKKKKKRGNKKEIKPTVLYFERHLLFSGECITLFFFFPLIFFKYVQVIAAATLIFQVLLDFALVCYVVKSWLWHKKFL